MGMNWQKVMLLFFIMAIITMVLFLPAPLHAQDLTPTPDAEGIIYIEVQANDTLWAISARAGLTLQELLDLNGLSEADFIQPGQKLIIGYGDPPTTPTVAVPPTATATRPPPTSLPPTATPPHTAVCLSAFHDDNLNGMQDAGEPLQAAVAFTIFTADVVVANYVTTGVAEPHCIAVEPGNYQITRSRAANENLTTSGNQAVALNQGDVMYITFGGFSAEGVQPVQSEQPAAYPATAVTPNANEETAVIGENSPIQPSPSPSGGQPNNPISLIPIGTVIIVGLMLTSAVIFFVRTRA